MFSIEADFDPADIEAMIQADAQEWIDELTDIYRQQMIKFVNRARAKTKVDGGFGNITWNLRGSIGGALVRPGQELEIYFPPLPEGSEGVQTGEDYVRELALLVDSDDEICVIVVAGMDYAFFVQVKTGDVIQGSSVFFEEQVTALLK